MFYDSTLESTVATHPEIKENHDPSEDLNGASSLSNDAPSTNKRERNLIIEGSLESTEQQSEKKRKTSSQEPDV